MFKKNSYCSYCGREFATEEKFPRECGACLNYTYINPLPVAVVLLAVWGDQSLKGDERLGTLIQQRNIEPKKGEWALSGGYINAGETWQQAAARELMEEIGLQTNPEDYSLMDIRSSNNNSNLLIFGTYTHAIELKDIHFVPNAEVSKIKVIYEPIELAFPTHTEMLHEYLKGHRGFKLPR